MPCRRANCSIELLRLDALLFMCFLFGDGLGKSFGVDEIDVSADPAQVAHGAGDGSFERAIVPPVGVSLDVDIAIRMSELDDPPWRLERAGRSGGHAGQCRGDLRDCPRFRQLALEADVADLSRP